jgi:mono/diheme cytochrome c family protein
MNVLRPLLPLSLLGLFACEAVPEDSTFGQDRYQGHYAPDCPSWVKSPVSGRMYCSSPSKGYDTSPAYAAAKPVVNDSAYEGFDSKSPDEKKALLIAQGEKVYANNCAACHQAGGTGSGTSFPPLSGDPVVNGGPVDEQIHTVLHGLSGKVINGVAYTGAMTPFATLTDNQIAAVITYERNSWGNDGGVVEPAQVKAAR